MADRPPYPGIPRWVKVSGIIVIALVVLVMVLLLTGVGGDHGPGRHTGAGGTSPIEVTEAPIPPAGGHASPIVHGLQ